MLQLFTVLDQLGCASQQVAAPAKTLGKCAGLLPSDGVYLIWTTRHITCVDRGQMIDWEDTTRRYSVVAIFKVTRNFDELPRPIQH